MKAYPNNKATDRVKELCAKCSGTGSVSWGVDVNAIINLVDSNGKRCGTKVVPQVCFDCNGVGYRMLLVSSIRARETLYAKQAAKAAADAAAYAAKYAAWELANKDLVNTIIELADAGIDFADQMVGRVLTDNQAAAILRIADQHAARKAEAEKAADVPNGRQVVTGEVVSIKSQDDPYSYTGGSIYKILVRDDSGFKVYGTMPKALMDAIFDGWYETHQEHGMYGQDVWTEDAKGRRVTFTATLEQSNDDAKFGFFKRPTNSSLLS